MYTKEWIRAEGIFRHLTCSVIIVIAGASKEGQPGVEAIAQRFHKEPHLIEQFGALKTRSIEVEGDGDVMVGYQQTSKSPGAKEVVKHRRLRNTITGSDALKRYCI